MKLLFEKLYFRNLHINKKAVLLHTLFWVSWVIFFTLIQSLGKGRDVFITWLMYYIITLPIFITHTYLIGYWLLPYYFFRNRFFLFTAGILILLMLFSIVELVVSNELVFKVFNPLMQFEPGYLNIKNILVSGVGNHYIILVFLAIKAGKSWLKVKTEIDDMARQNIESEIEIFRYQLQPEIILDLIRELEKVSASNPENVPVIIAKIADFMNNFLLGRNTELIPLSSELKLVDNFLSIQKVIAGNRIKTEITVSGDLSTWFVPPLIGSPFLTSISHIVSANNQEFEINVMVKAEKKYLLYSMTLWSENDFHSNKIDLSSIIYKRMQYSFQGRFRIVENTDLNFLEISLEIYSTRL